ncbi:hypothetical protein DYU11_11545 [Fibrisoma montanum]|uniref:Uncharacterized protein n=1 Tax=Fibrisoma montanum TaxID=2305895 RepID=A0A418MB66_9BACT|nr:hypothetical protein [Fibrisoma montanum]RIV23608.1 hypothetical protein DYU11_11545 [Fibrisoma montanum]
MAKRRMHRCEDEETKEVKFFIPPPAARFYDGQIVFPEDWGWIEDPNGQQWALSTPDCGPGTVNRPPNVIAGRYPSVRDIRIKRNANGTGELFGEVEPVTKQLEVRIFGPAEYGSRAYVTTYTPEEPSAYKQYTGLGLLPPGQYEVYYRPQAASDWAKRNLTITADFDGTIFPPEVPAAVGQVAFSLTSDRSQLNVQAELLNDSGSDALEIRMQGINGTVWNNIALHEMLEQSSGVFTHAYAYPGLADGMQLEFRINVRGQGAYVARFVTVAATGSAPVITGSPGQVNLGEDYMLDLNGFATGAQYYTILAKPGWLTYQSATNRLVGKAPSVKPNPSETLTIRAGNTFGTDEESFTLQYGQQTVKEAAIRLTPLNLFVGANPDEGTPPSVKVTQLSGSGWNDTATYSMTTFRVTLNNVDFTWSKPYGRPPAGDYLVELTFPGNVKKYDTFSVAQGVDKDEPLVLTDTAPSTPLAVGGTDIVPEGGSRSFPVTGGVPPYTASLQAPVTGLSIVLAGTNVTATVGNNTTTGDTRSAVIIVKDATGAQVTKQITVQDTSSMAGPRISRVRYRYNDEAGPVNLPKLVDVEVTVEGGAEAEIRNRIKFDGEQTYRDYTGWQNCVMLTSQGTTFYGGGTQNAVGVIFQEFQIRRKGTGDVVVTFEVATQDGYNDWKEVYPMASGTIATPSATNDAQNFAVAFTYTPVYNQVSRLQQVAHPAILDGWKQRTHELFAFNNGNQNETPAALKARGHGMLSYRTYNDAANQPWGNLPPSDAELFFEYGGGGSFSGYPQNSHTFLTQSLQQVCNTLTGSLNLFNSVPANGLIDGVATVKEGSYNLEYGYFSIYASNAQYNFNMMSEAMKDAQFFNYATGQPETVRQCFNRGGDAALTAALIQKWNNVILFATKYLRANCNGMEPFYGDDTTLAPILDVKDSSLNLDEVLASSVNNGGFYPQLNAFGNGGTITIPNGQTYNLDGQLSAEFKRHITYSYENYCFVKRQDYNEFFSITRNSPDNLKNIDNWYNKLQPQLTRPYTIAFHAALNWKILAEKGWQDHKFYWQTESIYEFDYLDKDTFETLNGAWVPWTINGSGTGNDRNTKLPLHREVIKNITFLSRLHFHGMYFWGAGTVIDVAQSNGENMHPKVHLRSRDAHQEALNELAQYNGVVFLPDKRQHILDIPVRNPANGQFVTGGPHKLWRANGNTAAQAVPLVTGVDSPSTGWELYFVYVPHELNTQTTTVTWRSPVDGRQLSGAVTGWGGRLFARKR